MTSTGRPKLGCALMPQNHNLEVCKLLCTTNIHRKFCTPGTAHLFWLYTVKKSYILHGMFLVGIVHNYIYLLILVLEKNSMLDFIFTH